MLLAFLTWVCHAVSMDNAKKLAEAEDRKLMASILKRREKPPAEQETTCLEHVNPVVNEDVSEEVSHGSTPMVKQARKVS
jgi:hypothetical protein